MIKRIIYLSTVIFLSSCISGGTHGSIKSYGYPVPKKELQQVVEKIINENANISRDTNVDYIDSTNGRSDTIYSNYYNDGDNYISFKIRQEDEYYNYTFRYLGDSSYWATSQTSEIFIAYAYDGEDNGGSEGNGGVRWYHFGLKSELTKPFELELINKIDSILGVKHTEG